MAEGRVGRKKKTPAELAAEASKDESDEEDFASSFTLFITNIGSRSSSQTLVYTVHHIHWFTLFITYMCSFTVLVEYPISYIGSACPLRFHNVGFYVCLFFVQHYFLARFISFSATI